MHTEETYEGAMMGLKRFQIGITNITYPYAPRWQNDFVVAENEEKAHDLAGEKGYYRNVVLRQCD